MMKFPIPPIFLLGLTGISAAQPDGALLYTQNCMACHMLDQALVGPSLVEIRELYLDKPAAFVEWSIKPQKKRPEAIDMPSMIHVGEDGLLAVHAHMMKLAEGVKAQKKVDGDPFANAPAQLARPQVMRIFMPDASPASIAVALDDQVSLCWDAGPCRLRYVWKGGFIDGYPYWKGNGSSLANIIGDKQYVELESPLPGTPKFQGYAIVDGLPVFSYRINDREVTETFKSLPDAAGIERSFAISPPPSQPLVMKFTKVDGVEFTSEKGKWQGATLTLTPQEAAAFTLMIRFP